MVNRASHINHLVSDQIKRLIHNPLPEWRVYQLTAISLGEDEHENKKRCRKVMSDLVGEEPLIARSQFELGTDNWVVYLATELSENGHSDRGVLVEMIDPYDVMDWASVVAAQHVSVAKLLPLIHQKEPNVVCLDSHLPPPARAGGRRKTGRRTKPVSGCLSLVHLPFWV